MCGVIGYWPLNAEPEAGSAFERLFHESSIRGLHAFGLAQPGVIERSFEIGKIPSLFDPHKPAVAHTRYCQSGDWRVIENNQPLVACGHSLVFNGCLHMGTKEEFEEHFGVHCDNDNDGEVFIRLFEGMRQNYPFEPPFNLYNVVLQDLWGSFAGTWLDESGGLWAGRNARRPLWKTTAYGARWYASTQDILKRAGFPPGEQLKVGAERAC
jgi:glutamine phosphoribosylpyrophosphate amidotransferase